MIQSLISRSASLLPQHVTGHLGWMRGAIGAAIAIAISGVIAEVLLGSDSHAFPWLMAPMGATAVLVFAVPASPLAQPWPVLGGNLISAIIGLSLGHLLGAPILAPALAVGAAIAAMSLARCLHPPGGACALLCAVGATSAQPWDWAYMMPISLGVFALVMVGWIYNNLTGHSWPHKATQAKSADTTGELAYIHDDLEYVLEQWDEMLDVDVDDLEALFRALRRRSIDRKLAEDQTI